MRIAPIVLPRESREKNRGLDSPKPLSLNAFWLPGIPLKAGPTKWLIPLAAGLYQLGFNQMLDRFSVFPGFQLFLSTHGF